MITLSDKAKGVLASGAGMVYFRVRLKTPGGSLAATLVGDIVQPSDSGVAPLRRSVRPLSREYEVGTAGVVLSNVNNWLSWRDASSVLYGTSFLGYSAEIDMMIPVHGAQTEVYRVYTGSVSGVTARSNGDVEMKFSDFHEVLRLSGPGDKVNATMVDDSPASLILTLLGSGYAGIDSDYIDSASFEAAGAEERLHRSIVRGFTLSSGTWLDSITALLQYSNGIMSTDRDGLISYTRMAPGSPAASLVLTEGGNMASSAMSIEKSQIRNKAHVERWDPVSSDMVVTGYGPITDSDSVAAYGERWDRTWSYRYFTENQPAALTAGVNLNLQSTPPDVLEVTGDLSLFALDLLDSVQVYSPRIGLSGEVFQVFECTLVPQSMGVNLTLLRTSLLLTPWLLMGSGHLLNGSKRIF